MILPSGHASKYLTDYKDGKIAKGLGLGVELDEFILFKRKQLNIVLGHDNVGKTYFMEWYFLALSSLHDIKHTIWMGENSAGQVMRDLIQMYTGRNFRDLNYKEIKRAEIKMEHWFNFVDNSKLYTPDAILDIFSKTDSQNYFIDPFTGLDRGMSHADNYDFLNKTRQFCNQLDKTIYISTHPNSESGRSSMIYPESHRWAGHLRAPLKAHIEGGKPFLNRCDDMITIHRLTKHAEMFKFTMIEVEKVKDRDTGGKQTELNLPIMCDYNFGLGFKIGGIDPIQRPNMIPIQQQIEMQQIEEKKKQIDIHRAVSNLNLTPEKSDFEQPIEITEYEKNKPDDCPF
jgi:hypothetical protein